MSNIQKICKDCKSTYPISDFPKTKNTKSGHINVCYRCERIRYNIRASRKSKELKNKISATYKSKYPEKRKAVNALKRVVKKVGHNLHHWSYNREHFKDCIELTVHNHNIIHKHLLYDENSKMYRRIDTMDLLNTKELHIEYINQFI